MGRLREAELDALELNINLRRNRRNRATQSDPGLADGWTDNPPDIRLLCGRFPLAVPRGSRQFLIGPDRFVREGAH
jgi:hypothetical protein